VPLHRKGAKEDISYKIVDLDLADARSYRPISNPTLLSKLLERFVARQLIDYLKSSMLLPQSAYTELTTYRQRWRL